MENYYDENGYLVKAERYATSDLSQPSSVVSYTNNENGLPTYRKTVASDGYVAEAVWKYDEFGNEVESGYLPDERYPDNQLQAYENVYNDQGQLVEKHSSSGDIWYYAYDAEGHLVEITRGRFYGDEFSIFSKNVYRYVDGKLMERIDISYSWNEEKSRTVYEYIYGTFYWYNAPEE
jgi:YD repeat-containing protein